MRCLAVAAAHGMHSPYTVGSRDGRTEGKSGVKQNKTYEYDRLNLWFFVTTKREIFYSSTVLVSIDTCFPTVDARDGLGATATNKYATRLDHPELHFEFVDGANMYRGTAFLFRAAADAIDNYSYYRSNTGMLRNKYTSINREAETSIADRRLKRRTDQTHCSNPTPAVELDPLG